MTSNSGQKSSEASFLPDLCGVSTVLTVMILSQLLAFILVLADLTPSTTNNFWSNLGLVSLFIHWVALSSTAVLCVIRKRLAKMTNRRAGMISYIVIMLVTFSMSLAVSGLERAFYPHADAVWGWLFALRNTGLGAIVAAIALRFIYLHHQQKLVQNAQATAHIEALQARIRPHFLFNSMNTIAALISTRPEDAEKAIEDLAELFRASLGSRKQGDSIELVSLATEFHYVKLYLQIEQLRLGDRLEIEWDLQQVPSSVRLPPLSLQPLIENAVYHGIEPLPEGGKIKIICELQDHLVNLVIENPKPEKKNGSGEQGRQGNSIALDNIRERLNYVFGNKGQMYLVEQGEIVRLILNFPADGMRVSLVEDEQ